MFRTPNEALRRRGMIYLHLDYLTKPNARGAYPLNEVGWSGDMADWIVYTLLLGQIYELKLQTSLQGRWQMSLYSKPVVWVLSSSYNWLPPCQTDMALTPAGNENSEPSRT